jgi:hypothetical protein
VSEPHRPEVAGAAEVSDVASDVALFEVVGSAYTTVAITTAAGGAGGTVVGYVPTTDVARQRGINAGQFSPDVAPRWLKSKLNAAPALMLEPVWRRSKRTYSAHRKRHVSNAEFEELRGPPEDAEIWSEFEDEVGTSYGSSSQIAARRESIKVRHLILARNDSGAPAFASRGC